MNLENHFRLYSDYLNKNPFCGQPSNLYDPMQYIMHLGGKRVRPILCLLGCEVVSGDANIALPVAHAMEIFHNFSLVHDDIMDRADQRRGLDTVHKKWNEPTAILVGDNLLVKAYESLFKFSGSNKDSILSLFTQTAIQVCEGQQTDMDFAEQSDVVEDQYLRMIRNKTAVLLGCSLASGAMAAGEIDQTIITHLYEFAIAVGMSFQMMDDYLDAFGDSEKVGKIRGGDIIEGKKTWLYIKSLELTKETDQWFKDHTGNDRIEIVLKNWYSMGLDQKIISKSHEYNDTAMDHLLSLNQLGVDTKGLKSMLDYLSQRSN